MPSKRSRKRGGEKRKKTTAPGRGKKIQKKKRREQQEEEKEESLFELLSDDPEEEEAETQRTKRGNGEGEENEGGADDEKDGFTPKVRISAEVVEQENIEAKSAEKAGANPSKAGTVANGNETGEDVVTWESLGLSEPMLRAVKAVKWKYPSEIQRESLPYSLQNRDIIGLAETGSGKTGAFAIPIVEALLEAPQPFFALVLAPTRELAYQISEQFEALGAEIGLKTAVIVGGMDMMDQAIILAKRPHIVVATPGRIVDHLENTKGFNLRKLKFLCMDEADRLLNLDFEKELDKILDVIPRERRTFLFSATMTNKVKKLQRASLSDPVKITVSHKYQTVSQLQQKYLFVPAKYKDVYLTYILNDMAGNSFMVFVATCEHAQRVSLMLRNLGFLAIPLHGKMSQPKRLGALNKYRSGESSILVATDVASRGLDIPHVDVVINYDVPTHSKDYIHRVGRTARAGRSGTAITCVTQYDVELFQRIEKLIGQKMAEHPTSQDSVMILLERVTEAQRIAAMDLRDSLSAEGGRKNKKQNRSAQRQYNRKRR